MCAARGRGGSRRGVSEGGARAAAGSVCGESKQAPQPGAAVAPALPDCSRLQRSSRGDEQAELLRPPAGADALLPKRVRS